MPLSNPCPPFPPPISWAKTGITSVCPSPIRVDMRTWSARAAIAARAIGATSDRAVAATVMAICPLPASVGSLHPKAASLADQGVKTIDLRADNAFEKLARALGQFKRPEDEARWREHDVNRASRKQRLGLGRNRIGHFAFVDAQRRPVSAFRRSLAHVHDKKRAVRLFNEFDSAAASEHRPEKRQAHCDVVDPSRQRGRGAKPRRSRPVLTRIASDHRNRPANKAIHRVLVALVWPLVVGPDPCAFVLVALVLEAKHDLRMNTPAVVEVDRD